MSAFHPFADTLTRRPISSAQSKEAVVSAENWHEERDRLVQLLEALESGKITHLDESELGRNEKRIERETQQRKKERGHESQATHEP